MAAAAETAYRGLVETDGLRRVLRRGSARWRSCGMLRLGSRPARRGAGGSRGRPRRPAGDPVGVRLERRPACNLPGWFGLGTGLAAVADRPRRAARAPYREWPLFALADRQRRDVAGQDRPRGRRALPRAGRPTPTSPTRSSTSSSRTSRGWCSRSPATTGCSTDRPVLRRAVDLRNPYVDALSHLQLRALTALRTDDAPDARADGCRRPAPAHRQRRRRRPAEHRLSR